MCCIIVASYFFFPLPFFLIAMHACYVYSLALFPIHKVDLTLKDKLSGDDYDINHVCLFTQ